MTTPPAPHASPSRQIGWRRIAVPSTWAAVILAAVTALATTAASVIAGRLAEHTSARLVTLLAVTVLGGALVDTAALIAGLKSRKVGGVALDQDSPVGTRQRAGGDIDPVHPVVARRHPDDPAEQFGGADRHRLIGLRARAHRLDAG